MVMKAEQRSGFLASPDGARIGYTVQGSGPGIIVVHCVSCDRTTTPQRALPGALAEHFTVITYDRRGNGESSTGGPYAVEREIDDLAVLLDLVDGPVDAYGFSSGAVLALLAARSGVPLRRLALLEPPLLGTEDSGADDRLRRLIAERRHQEARECYLTDVVGVPDVIIEEIRFSQQDLDNAPTLLHEMAFLREMSPERFRGLATPTLLMRSDHTVPEMAAWAHQLTEAMPHARPVELPGHWHGVDDATLVTAIREFLR
jgi:pimeloyl-ACP methyl ester carboxylesterase